MKVVTYTGEFNYSAVNNLGVKHTTGEYILLLNNDTEVITVNWMEELLMYAQREDVGAVGAKMYYEDKTIQHAGVVITFIFMAIVAILAVVMAIMNLTGQSLNWSEF